MHRPHYAQRQHIVHAFDYLLYQLHTLSFFLSPSIWGYIFRIISQFQCAKPKDIDLAHSLRFYCMVIITLNLPNILMHIAYGPAEGRAVILDFVGMSFTPSRLQLFSLDATILFLQLLLIIISYETAAANHPEGEDILLPEVDPPTPLPMGLPTPIASRPPSPSSSKRRATLAASYLEDDESTVSIYSTTKPPTHTSNGPPEYIIDLRIRPILSHLRNPPPPPTTPRADAESSGLPLPNTASVRLPSSLRMLMRSQAALARRSTADVIAGGQLPPRRSTASVPQGPATDTGGRSEGRFPGAMDAD